MDQPYQLTREIILLRGYADTKAALDRAKSLADSPTGPMAELVWEITGLIWREDTGQPLDDDDELEEEL